MCKCQEKEAQDEVCWSSIAEVLNACLVPSATKQRSRGCSIQIQSARRRCEWCECQVRAGSCDCLQRVDGWVAHLADVGGGCDGVDVEREGAESGGDAEGDEADGAEAHLRAKSTRSLRCPEHFGSKAKQIRPRYPSPSQVAKSRTMAAVAPSESYGGTH